MSKNKIRPSEHGVRVELDPNYLINHATYMPDGETIIRSNMTLGQMIEAIAFAHINQKLPEKKDLCRAATIKFEDGRFIVIFADSVDNLTF